MQGLTPMVLLCDDVSVKCVNACVMLSDRLLPPVWGRQPSFPSFHLILPPIPDQYFLHIRLLHVELATTKAVPFAANIVTPHSPVLRETML